MYRWNIYLLHDPGLQGPALPQPPLVVLYVGGV